MKTMTKEMQEQMTPKDALEILIEGNKRFVQNHRVDRDLMEQVRQTSKGQYPFAVILSCVDSRTSSELIFDLGIGDVFNARIAGNIINEDILGSMEFANLSGVKQIIVLGHTKCGAIKGACDTAASEASGAGSGSMPSNLAGLLAKITPSIKAIPDDGDRTSANMPFVEKVSKENVKQMVKMISDKSPLLKESIASGKIGITGGMYDIETGKVEFYDQPAGTQQA